MTLEVRPVGDKCNLGCTYCYQQESRDAGTFPDRYDMPAMLAALDGSDEPFVLFGGEIMLTKRDDLVRLLELGVQRGGAALQTNGTLVDEKDLELFRRYQVRVGVSIDGPGVLNDARQAGGQAATQRATALTEGLIEVLCHEGMPPSVIVTLHRLNALGDRLERLCEWLAQLDSLGVRRIRLHLLQESGSAEGTSLALDTAGSIVAMRRLRQLETTFANASFDVFREIRSLLEGRDDAVSCAFRACDPYSTEAVRGIEGDGTASNCGRVSSGGAAFAPAQVRRYDRQTSLHATSQAEGGCRGCRFFVFCKGNCPGTAPRGDWRLRSGHCPVWMALFEDAERELVGQGLRSLSTWEGLGELEQLALARWAGGEDALLRELVEEMESHGT